MVKLSHCVIVCILLTIYTQILVLRLFTQRNQPQGDLPDPTIDVLSIGSKFRVPYQQAQRETIGSHPWIRNFIAVTEKDDTDPECYRTSNSTVKSIVEYCRDVSWTQRRIDQVFNNRPLSRIRGQRSTMWGYDKLSTNENPAGWLCAQRRPAVAFFQYMKHVDTLPDYLWIIDDDTYIDVKAVAQALQRNGYPEKAAVAGCRLYLVYQPVPMPWGGFGLFLTKSYLEQMNAPIHCGNPKDTFAKQSCQQLRKNVLGELPFFRDGDSLVGLMKTVVSSRPLSSFVSTTVKDTFCFHSDWIWQFFINLYPTSDLVGPPDVRLSAYEGSEKHNYLIWGRKTSTGQCRNQGQCPIGSHICHHIDPDSMLRLKQGYDNTRGN